MSHRPIYLPKTTREEWLAARRKGIGSSDAAPACDASPYGTPLSVFASKVWGVEDEETDAMRIGTLMEPVISQMYLDRNRLHGLTTPRMMQHPDHEWMLASIDRIRTDGRIVELKNSSVDGWGEQGTDEVPIHIYLQVQHQQAVYSPHEPADVAVIYRGNRFLTYTINPSVAIQGKLIETEGALWEMIQERRQPAPNFMHERTAELLNRLNEPVPSKQVEALNADAVWQVENYERLGQEIAALKRHRDELKGRIIAEMGKTWALSLPDGRVLRRKAVEVKGYTVDPRTQIDMRIVSRKAVEADIAKMG